MFMKEWVRFSGSIIQTSFLQEVHALLPLLQSVFLGYMAILGESLLYLLSRQLFLGLYLLSLNPADLVSCKLWDFPVLGLHQPHESVFLLAFPGKLYHYSVHFAFLGICCTSSHVAFVSHTCFWQACLWMKYASQFQCKWRDLVFLFSFFSIFIVAFV